MSRRVLAGTALGGVLVLSVAACSGKSGTGAEAFHPSGSGTQDGQGITAAALVGQVAQQTDKVDTFKFRMAMQMPGGTYMHATGQMRLHPSLAMAMNIDSMNMAGKSLPGGITELLVNGALYIKAPTLAQRSGKPWIRVPLDKLGNAGASLDQLSSESQDTNPADQVQQLLASKNIRKLGTETIDGVQTVHYAGSVSTEEAMAKADPQRRERLRQALEKGGLTSTDYDLWVGPDSLPIKIVAKPNTSAGQMTMTLTYSDYGTPVHITAPSAGQVGELPAPSMPKPAPTAPVAGI